MKKDDTVYLFHIRDSINLIIKYLGDISFEEFSANSMIQDALIRQLQIIGQATSRLSNELREKHSNVPWKILSG